MLSVHTSPLDGPGNGDAGGMNVYVLEAAKRLAAAGVEVEVFTRATSSDLPARVDVEPGVAVNHVLAGPYGGLAKDDLPAQLCAFTVGVLRAEARQRPGYYDLVHSHYWLSGQVGWVAKERWHVPLVHSMHTMARVKNLALADGDRPEPAAREIGEAQVVEVSDRLVGNTADEADQLIRLYGADPQRTAVVHPGVDLDVFTPGSAGEARRALGLADDAIVLLFAGRVQPLKGPDVVIDTAASLLAQRPQLRDRLVVAVVGGPSGSGTGQLERLEQRARALGIGDLVRFVPAVSPTRLAVWYRAATATLVPSHSESFGLVALESQACGTPVVAAGVGGLTTAVRDGRSGLLVAGHEPSRYAAAVGELLDDADRRAAMARAAVRHAAAFSWEATAQSLLDAYSETLGMFAADVQGLSA